MQKMAEGSHSAITLEAGKYRATVDPLGAALRTLHWGERELVWGYPEGRPQLAQGQILLPWPNRIDHGRYSFGGTTYQLEITEPELDNAIHGLTSTLLWQPSQITADSVRFTLAFDGAPGYPFRMEFWVCYSLDPDHGLHVRIGAQNTGDGPAPYGHGSHNYLTLELPVDEVTLQLPAAEWQPVNERMIPTGPVRSVAGTDYDFRTPRQVGPTVLDTAFTGLRFDEAGRSWTVLSAGELCVGLWADDSHPWLQVFSADYPGPERRRHLAVEPMTCPPNAFVTGTDLIVLDPGQSIESSFGITSTPE